MKKIACLLLVVMSVAAFGQHKNGIHHAKAKGYNPSDYPSDQYRTRIDTASLGVIKLQSIHVQSKALSEEPECKAWLIVKKGNKTTAQLFYDDIMKDYGITGVFFPTKQPREDLFIAFKLGDYDGRIIIVDRDGNVNNMPGGEFYMSEDNKYLFADYSSDQPGLTVIDLDKNNLVYSDSASGDNKLGAWYYEDDKFFAVAQPKEDDDTSKVTIETLDFKKKKLISSQEDKSYPQKDNKLKFYTFYDKPENKGNCSCGKQ